MNLQNVFKHMSQYWEVYEYVRDGAVTLDAIKEHLMRERRFYKNKFSAIKARM